MLSLGGYLLLAIVIMVNSILPSILSYSAEVWLDAPMYAVHMVESAFKKMVFSVFEIPANTKIAAVYLEHGMFHMQHMVQKLQLLYVIKVVWEKKPHATLIEEWHVLGKSSMLAKLRCDCIIIWSSELIRGEVGQEACKMCGEGDY